MAVLEALNNTIDVINLKPFILNLCIVDKEIGIKALHEVIHPAQLDMLDVVNEQMNKRRPCRVIVLKARQIGMSTIIEAIQFALAKSISRFRGLVISHETDSAEHLLGMTQNYFDTFFAAEHYTQRNKSAKVLSWVETKSQIRIATAKNTGSGRSRTIHFLHASEVGFWDNADTLMTGLLQAIPETWRSWVFLESTANGIGNYFHKRWNAACSGESDYIPRFYPWWTHPEYTASALNLPLIRGHLDEEERKLVKLMKNPPRERWNNFSCDPLPNAEILERLTWRRYAIKNKCEGDLDKFHQEYPATPTEAFLSTGQNIFPSEILDECFSEMEAHPGSLTFEGNKVRFQRHRDGPCKIYKRPTMHGEYIVSGDSKRSIEGDFACIQVLNRQTWEQVATYRSKVDNVTFGEEMLKLAYYYNTALTVCEIEGGGYGTVAVLLDRNYPKVWQHQKAEKMPGQVDNSFGWSTNWKTKSQAIGVLKKAVLDKSVILHDQTTVNEMRDYVSLGSGKFGNGELEEHDDTVMSLAIAVTVIIYEAAELLTKQSNSPSGGPVTRRDLRNVTMEERERPGELDDIALDDLPDWMSWSKDDEPEHV